MSGKEALKPKQGNVTLLVHSQPETYSTQRIFFFPFEVLASAFYCSGNFIKTQTVYQKHLAFPTLNRINVVFHIRCSWNYLLIYFTVIYHCVCCSYWFANKDVNTFYCESFHGLPVSLCTTCLPLGKLFNVPELKFSHKAYLIGLLWKLNQRVCIPHLT